MSEVLGLDAVVAVHLAGVQEAAQTQAVQADRQDVSEDEDMIEDDYDNEITLPIISSDTVDGEHGQGTARHGALEQKSC